MTAHRKQLADAVLENPTSADAWVSFLEQEECQPTVHGSPTTVTLVGSSSSRCVVTLLHLYQKATELVVRTKGRSAEAYVKLWVGYAKQQWWGPAAQHHLVPTSTPSTKAPHLTDQANTVCFPQGEE